MAILPYNSILSCSEPDIQAMLYELYTAYAILLLIISQDLSRSGSHVWWSQKSRQFLVENKTKHTHSRKLVLSARINLRWRLIVQRLMNPLVIVKREVRSQVAHGVWNALVIFDVHLLVFDTAP